MRIFISHGTDKDNPLELAFLNALEQLLRSSDNGAMPHDVLLDRTRLEAGDDWEGVLHDWLAECQVAILLLSKRALDRPWVLKEATILSFRKKEDAAFPLIPVLMPGVTPEMINSRPGFSALRLDAYQAFGAGSAPEEVRRFIDDRLTAIPYSAITPLDRLERVLETRIAQADVQAIEQACEDVLGEAVAWSPSIDRARQRARVFARAITRGRLGRLLTLTKLTQSLTGAALAKEQCRRVLDLAASMWVEEEVAARLRDAIARSRIDGAPLAVALNSNRVRHGARMAVWRAQLPDIADNVYWIAGGGSDAWASEIVEGMCKAYLEGNKNDVVDLDDAKELLSTRTEPVFFVIPPPLPDEALLLELNEQFPSVIFIAHTGAELPSDMPDYIASLTPGLRVELEKTSRNDYLSAQEFIR